MPEDANTFTDYFCYFCGTCGTEIAGWGDLPEGFDPDNFCECDHSDEGSS
jgi:hypothetical protein